LGLAQQSWEALTPLDAAAMFAGYGGRWWIGGGWAIDLFLRRQTRSHGDIDVAVLWDEQPLLREHFRAREIHVAHDGKLTPWVEGDWLTPPRHQFWARRQAGGPWTLEFLLEEVTGGSIAYRRDRRVKVPLSMFGRVSDEGVPYIAPEVALLYKAGSVTMARNAADFDAAHPNLDLAARSWLRGALELAHPGHPWIDRLR